MKCYTVSGRGLNAVHLEERPEPPEPAAGEALVEVLALSLNYRDLMVADGRYSGVLDPPIIALSDFCGRVLAVGDDVTRLAPGDRVLNHPFRRWPAGTLRSDWSRTFIGGGGVDGIAAERVLYPADALVKTPEHFDDRQAATLTIAGLTAWAAVVTHGHTQPGERVLVLGTGGVSVFAAQIAHAMGARTILLTSSVEKARIAREQLGVEATLDYRLEDWPDRVREITGGRGVDVVVDVVGGPTLAKSVKACGYGARIGLIGVLEGRQGQLDSIDLIYHQVSVRGIFMESAEELERLARACETTHLEPVVDRAFPFAELPAAYEYLRSAKHLGKVVVDVASS